MSDTATGIREVSKYYAQKAEVIRKLVNSFSRIHPEQFTAANFAEKQKNLIEILSAVQSDYEKVAQFLRSIGDVVETDSKIIEVLSQDTGEGSEKPASG